MIYIVQFYSIIAVLKGNIVFKFDDVFNDYINYSCILLNLISFTLLERASKETQLGLTLIFGIVLIPFSVIGLIIYSIYQFLF